LNKPKLWVVATVATALLGLGASATPALAGDLHTDIVGGHEPSQAYPGMAALEIHLPDGRMGFCGAQLVFHRWVAVNAHCVTTFPDASPVNPSWLRLRIGSANRIDGGEVAGVTKVLPHAGWHWAMNPGPVDDLAMLELDHYIQKQPFSIAATVRTKPGVRLLGWGVTEPDGEGPLPVDLQELDTRLLPADQCAAGGITAGELCVANVNGTDGPCFGDSGGPALQRVPGTSRWATIGGASRETAHACGTAPVIYTNLSYFRSWMYEVARTGQVPPDSTSSPAVTGPAKQLRWSGTICHDSGSGCGPNLRV